MDIRSNIKAEAIRLGFSFCGTARSGPLDHIRDFYTAYVDSGKHAPFTYLKSNFEQRLDPSLLLPGVQSVVALLMSYHPPKEMAEKDGYIIAKYALGNDYHPLMKERLGALAHYITTLGPGIENRFFVDSGPVLEKAWAGRCGLGWIGKNSILINKKQGSFFFIGIILTTLEIEPDFPETDHCGDCRRCVDACPTGALDTPYELNISRCLSFHTIENRAEIPDEINQKRGGLIYGCDICQDVCPYNRFAIPTTEPTLIPSDELLSMRKEAWQSLTKEQFDNLFANSSVKRRGFERFTRTIATSTLSV